MKLDGLPWARHWPFTGAVLALSLFGVAMIYSAGVKNIPSPVTEGIWVRQAIVLLGSILVLIGLSQIPSRWFEWMAIPLYLLSLGVLAVTLVIGTGSGTAEGMRSFLNVAGFQFQPGEAAKITTALALAKLLARKADGPEHLRDLLWPVAIVGAPLALVVLQPDLGTALAFVGIFFAAIFWAGTPWPMILFTASPGLSLILSFSTWIWSAYFLSLIVGLYIYRYRLYLVESFGVILANLAAGAIAQPLWNSLQQYQRNRILVFLDPDIDPQGAGWQLVQSKVAVGSGGVLGKGFTLGTQKRLNFLPEQHTDFIFSVVGEELGFVGTSLALVVFGYLFFRMIRLAQAFDDPFSGIFVFAILGVWLTHVVVNVGMTVGVVPITGIPLPFISYGGSFLLMSWVAAGLVVGMARDVR